MCLLEEVAELYFFNVALPTYGIKRKIYSKEIVKRQKLSLVRKDGAGAVKRRSKTTSLEIKMILL